MYTSVDSLGVDRRWKERQQRTAVPIVERAVPVFSSAAVSSAAKHRSWKRSLIVPAVLTPLLQPRLF